MIIEFLKKKNEGNEVVNWVKKDCFTGLWFKIEEAEIQIEFYPFKFHIVLEIMRENLRLKVVMYNNLSLYFMQFHFVLELGNLNWFVHALSVMKMWTLSKVHFIKGYTILYSVKFQKFLLHFRCGVTDLPHVLQLYRMYLFLRLLQRKSQWFFQEWRKKNS